MLKKIIIKYIEIINNDTEILLKIKFHKDREIVTVTIN